MYDVASEMLNAQKYLEIVRKRGEANAELKRVYRNIRQRGLFFAAYGKLYSNEGATTPGVDPDDTVDGMSLQKIDTILNELENGTYQWKPVRRTYIEKKMSKKLRPLGMPGWRDKLLQEVIRMVLEAYYEPQFRKSSHGFRPNRGCHTALNVIRKTWTGTKWFVETDISGCFDNLDHHFVIEILGRKIKDTRFLKLMKGMLKAGYMEDWKYHQTYSGTPQGGICSPLLMNIVLNELDTYIEDVVIPEFTKGTRKGRNPDYRRLESKKRTAKRSQRKWEWNQFTQEMRKIPSQDVNDPNYRRLRYIRYADDSLLGLEGTRQDAEIIKEKLGEFLKNKLRLEMSKEKTLITHAKTGKAKFLGYEIHTDWEDTKITQNTEGIKRRSINGNIVLTVPEDVYKKWKAKVHKHGKVGHRPELLNNSDFDIISTYESELQGLINYYALAHNMGKKMTRLRYFWSQSLAKTLAGKHKTKVTQILRKHTKYTADGRQVITVEVRRKGKKPFVATFGRKPIERQLNVEIKDEISKIYTKRNELLKRLEADACEICGSTDNVQAHHIRKLADLKRKYKGKEPPIWVKKMIAIRRKTLFVCKKHHDEIHQGKYDGKKLTK